jgi:Flp pilus assembly protein TadG
MGRPGQTGEKGQAFVELVLVANVLLLVVLGIFQFGVVFSHKIQITDAARAAARKAATYGGTDVNDGTLRDAAEAAGAASAAASTEASGMTVSWQLSTAGWVSGSDVTATTSIPAEINILGVSVWSGNLTSSATMRIEKRGVTG